jgi:hypothetical protein
MSIEEIVQSVREFRDERDCRRFHTPKDLARRPLPLRPVSCRSFFSGSQSPPTERSWSIGDRQVRHPSVQVRQYETYLRDGHSAFYDTPVLLSGCVYLHNYEPATDDTRIESGYKWVLFVKISFAPISRRRSLLPLPRRQSDPRDDGGGGHLLRCDCSGRATGTECQSGN